MDINVIVALENHLIWNKYWMESIAQNLVKYWFHNLKQRF